MPLGAHQLDAATADAIAGEISRASKHSLPPGTPCPNRATPLAGPWRHACGQKGEAGTHRTSVFGTLARMFLLFIGSSIAFSLLIVGLPLIGLATAH